MVKKWKLYQFAIFVALCILLNIEISLDVHLIPF